MFICRWLSLTVEMSILVALIVDIVNSTVSALFILHFKYLYTSFSFKLLINPPDVSIQIHRHPKASHLHPLY